MPPLFLFLLFSIFLFCVHSKKKVRHHQQVLNNLRRGDRIVTSGGLIGTISKILNDQEMQVEIAENVKVRIRRAMITEVLSKSEAVANDAKDTAQLT